MKFVPYNKKSANRVPKTAYLMCFACKESVDAAVTGDMSRSQICVIIDHVPTQAEIEQLTDEDELYLGHVEFVA